jgi:hypothetical protein
LGTLPWSSSQADDWISKHHRIRDAHSSNMYVQADL